MDLEQAIHRRWETDAGLTARVPASRFVSGRAEGIDGLPFVVLQLPVRRTRTNTTASAIEEARVEFNVWTANLQQATEVLHELRRRYHRQSFAVGEDECLVMQHDADRWVAGDDGVWHAVATYIMLIRVCSK